MLRHTLYFALFVFLAVLFSVCAIHSAWIAATPVPPRELHTAQLWLYIYMALLAGAVICAIGTIVRMIVKPKSLD